jgi:hypothetical protein
MSRSDMVRFDELERHSGVRSRGELHAHSQGEQRS